MTPTVVVQPGVAAVTPLGDQWSSNVRYERVETAEGCFFFSGPGDLGRNNTLGTEASWSRQGGVITLDFGGGVVFRGPEGEAVELRRDSMHDFGGQWKVQERLLGVLRDRELNAEYTYQECELGTDACPGRCVIRAYVVSVPSGTPL